MSPDPTGLTEPDGPVRVGGAAATGPTTRLLVFGLGGQLFALRLADVERVIQAVELTPVPRSPRMVRGVFCLHGRFIPVADLSDRLGLPGKELAPSDRIVIARVGSRPMGFLTDGHTELVECPSREITDGDPAIFGTEAVEGVVRLSNGVAWIQNLRRLLTLADEASPIDGTAQCS